MKIGLLSLLLFFAVSYSFAQADTIHLKNNFAHQQLVTDRPPQAVYFGLGGSAPIFSANYDRRFGNRLNGWGFTAGLGFFGATDAHIFSIPASINYLMGRKDNFLELAAGATFATAAAYDFFDGSNSSAVVFGHLNLGYRHQPSLGGFFARTGFSPIFFDGEYFTSFYLGLGYAF